MKYAAELAPIPRLVIDEPAPLATRIWLITEYGTGYAGSWHPECGAVAWSPLPRLRSEDKARLKEMVANGVDVTRFKLIKEVNDAETNCA